MGMMKHPGKGCDGHCCLKIENLGVKIDGSEILHDVSLHLHCGEIVALIGPNGAGKSTMIKSILGQMEHSGVISFQPAGGRSRKFRIGYVPQSPNFDPGDPISVLDLFSLCTQKAPVCFRVGKNQRETVLSCLRNVHGEGLIDKKVGALSGGELQRVLLALALEPVPDILILDEPMSGVDVEGMQTLMTMLDEIRRNFDLSILMVTHDFSMLSRFVDRAVLLKETVLTQGTPEEVLASKEFRAAFQMGGGREA